MSILYFFIYAGLRIGTQQEGDINQVASVLSDILVDEAKESSLTKNWMPLLHVTAVTMALW